MEYKSWNALLTSMKKLVIISLLEGLSLLQASKVKGPPVKMKEKSVKYVKIVKEFITLLYTNNLCIHQYSSSKPHPFLDVLHLWCPLALIFSILDLNPPYFLFSIKIQLVD